jgi:hypothetical protein
MPEEKPPAQSDIPLRRSEDFSSVYADNVAFESSVWGLKVFLGELDQGAGGGTPGVEFHTAVSIPWMAAKLFIYWLRLNLAFYEINNGKINIPERLLPPKPSVPDDPENPVNAASYAVAKRLHDEFMADL